MLRHARLEHRFVHHVPEVLDPGVLYISVDFATAAHRCCCGCGAEVVTPFTPTDWRMTFDGETISLRPSIGNWNTPCRSHYVINRNRIIEAGPWDEQQIQDERGRDKKAKARFYGTSLGREDEVLAADTTLKTKPRSGRWRRIKQWFR